MHPGGPESVLVAELRGDALRRLQIRANMMHCGLRQKRMQRLRMVIAQQEAGYRAEYLESNGWSQGPFYYEEAGRQQYEKVTGVL